MVWNKIIRSEYFVFNRDEGNANKDISVVVGDFGKFPPIEKN